MAREHQPLIDVGCGRGELLDLCRAAAIEARGFDCNERSVADLVARGFDATVAGVPECFATFAAVSQWIDGDTVNDTPKIKVGDLVFYVGTNGNAIQTVTGIDLAAKRIYFNQGDFFRFNQPNATNEVAGTGRPLTAMSSTPGSNLLPEADNGTIRTATSPRGPTARWLEPP